MKNRKSPLAVGLRAAALLCAVLVSCGKEEIKCEEQITADVDCRQPTNDASLSRQLILGEWEWTYEKYWDRITRKIVISTPQTRGSTQSFKFVSPRNAEFYRNGVLVERYNYEIAPFSELTAFPEDTSERVVILRNPSSNVMVSYVLFRVCNDSLYLNYQRISDFKGNDVYSRK